MSPPPPPLITATVAETSIYEICESYYPCETRELIYFQLLFAHNIHTVYSLYTCECTQILSN